MTIAMKTVLIAFCLSVYIAIGLPFSAVVGMYFLLRSIPKTWTLLQTRLFGPQRKSEAKELEEKYTKLYRDILARMAREAEAPQQDRLEVFTISKKWGNC